MTPPEVKLWVHLRHRSEGEPTFRRQHPFGPFILDFYCSQARLAVEVDGMGHGMGDQPQRDQRRDAYLARHGVRVERISARAVFEAPEWIAIGLRRLAKDLIEHD
jgi:very-short-patch-repair endonuclease